MSDGGDYRVEFWRLPDGRRDEGIDIYHAGERIGSLPVPLSQHMVEKIDALERDLEIAYDTIRQLRERSPNCPNCDG
jgi:hypothetical protein